MDGEPETPGMRLQLDRQESTLIMLAQRVGGVQQQVRTRKRGED